MTTGVPAIAIALAKRASSHGKVVIYAGAGISVAQPTGLPLGSGVAEKLHATLRTAFPQLDSVDPSDLVAIADVIASLPGGGDALRETAAKSAEFRTATPSYGHRVLAYLLLEGVVDVLTTNWDDCIERGGLPERLQAVTDEHSLHRVEPPSVLKVHGCASVPDSLLVTSSDLAEPPTWAREQTQARLGSAVVVFLGIGDVAGYVRNRIEEAITDVGDILSIRVVSPSIIEQWSSSQWATVIPNLPEEHRIAATSDEFLEHLGAAYIHVTLSGQVAELADDPQVLSYMRAAVDCLLASDALSVLTWVRGATVAAQQGVSVLAAGTTAEALTALGRLAGGDRIQRQSQVFGTVEGPIEILVATKLRSSRSMELEAQNRLSEYASRGQPIPRFLIAGGIGWRSAGGDLPNDVLNENDATDILDGPSSLTPEILLSQQVLAS